MKKTKTQMISTIFAVIVVGLVFLAVFKWTDSIFGGSTHRNKSGDQISRDGESFSNPIKLQAKEMMVMTGEKFVDKYQGQWISFDGVLGDTVTQDGDDGPRTAVMLSEGATDNSFSDMATMRILARAATFDDSLQQYASEYHMSTESIKVHVVAKVDYRKNISIYLSPTPNTPSVTRL